MASASPRRRELLTRLGLSFEVVPSAVAEALPPGTPAARVVADLALAKARDVAGGLGPGAVVLGADTLVVLEGRPFGKPASRDEARAMLVALRGRAHEVVTGVAVLETTAPRREAVETVTSQVVMRDYAETELEAYVATPEPYDKAGAYAVQGLGGRLVARVEGCYTNVVGLPVSTTARLLRAFGLEPTLSE
ncbi:MAG TPA: Maf family protein [Methylomirabilota bacterium]|nr:Maf family protein [Methylomirabilota bacterium]